MLNLVEPWLQASSSSDVRALSPEVWAAMHHHIIHTLKDALLGDVAASVISADDAVPDGNNNCVVINLAQAILSEIDTCV